MNWKQLRHHELSRDGFVVYLGPPCAFCGLPTPPSKQATAEDSDLVLCVVCTGEED